MRQNYEEPSIEIIEFSEEDIIRTSGNSDDHENIGEW